MPYKNVSQEYILRVADALAIPPLAYEVLRAKGQVFPQRSSEALEYLAMGECFANALELAQETGLHYVEGYAIAGDIPIPLDHAWCVDDQGLVYDNTWRKGHSYFGMAFNPESLDFLLNAIGHHCILGNLWRMSKLGLPKVRQLLLDAALPINVANHP